MIAYVTDTSAMEIEEARQYYSYLAREFFWAVVGGCVMAVVVALFLRSPPTEDVRPA